jgi:transposase-like protein
MKEENTALIGASRLLNTLKGKTPNPSQYPFDEEAEVVTELSRLEFIDPSTFATDALENHSRVRARIRYLAALWPDANLNDLTHRIHGLVNNKNFDVDDIRTILQGRRLNDTSKITNEIPLPVIQGIGKCLKEGKSLRLTAREMRVSYDTVESIEKYLGVRSAQKMKLVDQAVDAAREGTSIRNFAKQVNVSRSKAHRLLIQGTSVLKELGEIK